MELRSAATPVAVCSFCRSTLARDGDALRRLGQSAELFDDHSPLQLGASGRWNVRPFTVIGRLQWRTADAAWNEWLVLHDDGTRAWLSEDNGRYVMAVDADVPSDFAQAGNAAAARESLLTWQPGQGITIGGRAWTVASVVSARIAAAEGELTRAPSIDERVTVVDLRNPLGQVATLSASSRAVDWSVGQGVELASLSLTGLRAESAKEVTTRGVQCPSCGTALSIKLDTTKSIACHQCKAVVDLSKGIGGDLEHYKQSAARDWLSEPLIALGLTGDLALGGPTHRWQVVGYQVRRVVPEPGDDPEPPWTEYLLYSRGVGFAFLVNATEGWSWAVPMTGVPTVAGSGAKWAGRTYVKRYDYAAQTSYVLGEFYWQVQRDQRTRITDYASGKWRMNREQQGTEVTWSDGHTLPATAVLQAFGIKKPAGPGGAAVSDGQPLAFAGSLTVGRVVLLVVMLLIIMALMSLCSSDRCDGVRQTHGASSVEYQQCLRRASGSTGGARVGGGSWGGSSGGGHK